jgi:integrase
LRSSEIVGLRWDDFDLARGRLHVRRSKGSDDGVHPVGPRELRALRRLRREADATSPFVFVSERGAPLSVAGYQRMIARVGTAARFPFLVHSHMLRHSTDYKLANDGQDTRAIQGYLGHRSIMSTQRYTALHRIGSSAFGRTESWRHRLTRAGASLDHLGGARYSSGAVGGGRKTVSGIQSLARIALASSRSTWDNIVC